MIAITFCSLQRLNSAVSIPVDVDAIATSLKELIVPPQKVAFSVKK